MHWVSGIIVVLGLSLGAVVLSAGQETPAVQAPTQDTVKQQAPEAEKNGPSAGKGDAPADAKREGKGVGDQQKEDSGERKTEAQPGKNDSAKSAENPDPQVGGRAESKTTESKAAPKTGDKAEPEAGAESNAKPDQESDTGAGRSAVSSPRIANTNGADAGAAGSSIAGEAEAHRLRSRPPVPAAVPPKGPRKIVVREGGANDPAAQIVTGMTVQEASSERRETEKFLDAAEENLRRVTGRTLDPRQQETISQILNYVEHARSALKEGDISRGHTLALKANLLADDLVKH
jgi:hypothetical protein